MKKKINKNKWIIVIILALGSLVMLFPFIWMMLSSFKTVSDVYKYPPKWLPSCWKFNNYSKVFEMIPFGRYYFNSIYTSVVQTIVQIGISVMAAYAFAVLKFPGKSSLIVLFESTMFVPKVVTLIPMYLLVSQVHLIDTYAGIILPQILSAFIMFLILSFFCTIPKDLFDSAKLDGCGYYRILSEVVIPNGKSAISTAALFSFLGHWKSYAWPLIVTNNQKYRTLPIGMKYLIQESSSEYQVMMAASVMAILPVIIVFIVFEKQLVRSITLTGLKA